MPAHLMPSTALLTLNDQVAYASTGLNVLPDIYWGYDDLGSGILLKCSGWKGDADYRPAYLPTYGLHNLSWDAYDRIPEWFDEDVACPGCGTYTRDFCESFSEA